MHRLSALYRVALPLRLLTAGAALATALSLPALLRSGAWLSAGPVFAAGLFCLSIALYGRSQARVRT